MLAALCRFTARTAVLLLAAASVAAQEPVDLDVVGRIREEGFQRSQVMELAWQMTDVLGPRLTGSPGMRRAQQWARQRMEELGLVNTIVEPFGEHGVGWTNVYTSLHLLEPSYQPLIGYPQAFTPGTAGKLTGQPRIVVLRTPADFAAHRGKLRGAIVLATPPIEMGPRFTADAVRFGPDTLTALERVAIASEFETGGRPHEWNDVIRTSRST